MNRATRARDHMTDSEKIEKIREAIEALAWRLYGISLDKFTIEEINELLNWDKEKK